MEISPRGNHFRINTMRPFIDTEISDINKFNYLHSFLCEEARSIISRLAPTSSNYTTAVRLL